MPSKEFEIIIPADGSSPDITALGFEGQQCSKDIEAILKGISAKTITSKRTADWYKKQKVQVNQRIR